MATRALRRVARRAGTTKPAGPHTLPHASITAVPGAGVPLRDVQDPKVREPNWVIRPVNPGPMSLLEGKHLLDDGG